MIFYTNNGSGLDEKMRLNFDEIIINQNDNDQNLRVESENNANMLLVDAGSDHVNDGTATDHGGVLNVETSDNSVNLVLACTDTDGNEGPILDLTRDAGNVPSDNDIVGKIRFRNDDTDLNMTNYVELTAVVSDVSNGTEDGQLQFNVINAGTLRNFAHMTGSNGTVFNEDGHDLDFRVETDNAVNALLVDASADTVNMSVPLYLSDVIASGSGGVSLQTDEGTKRLIVEDSGHVKMGEGPINTSVDTNGVISNSGSAWSWSVKIRRQAAQTSLGISYILRLKTPTILRLHFLRVYRPQEHKVCGV